MSVQEFSSREFRSKDFWIRVPSDQLGTVLTGARPMPFPLSVTRNNRRESLDGHRG